MKIVIVSDTHGNVANFKKAIEWIKKEDISVVLHCGDIGSPEDLKESLADFKGKFFGVLGNMDKDFKILIKEYNKVPRARIEEKILKFEIIGEKVRPFTNSCELVNGMKVMKVAITHRPEDAGILAESGEFSLVFYGHTHKPCFARRSSGSEGGGGKECLLVNPGELAGQLFKPSFAIYDTATSKLELKILEQL